MRLHRLEITAFGPFGDTVEVDFDRLGSGQLFLLCGDTGAGKTTVLDAVCFGFYGDVPGDRATARQLRSQHASPGTSPRVVLETTLRDRRFRFTRSPAWQRPKKRGAGTTTEQAHVLVEEHRDGAWEHLTGRLDEAGHLVTDLLGMTLTQFSQVVLLPQNQFDRFLHASSEERQKVLTRLFHTARFERVERWLADRRRALHRVDREHHDAVAAVLHRISEAADTPLPAWSEQLADAAADGSAEHWLAQVLDTAETAQQTAAAAEQRARARRDRRAEELQATRQCVELRARHDRARERQESLAAAADEADRDASRLDGHRRAAQVAAFLELAAEAATTHAAARDRAAELRARAGELLEAPGSTPDAARLATELAHHRESLARARAQRPRADQLGTARDELRRATGALADLEQGLARAREAAEQLPAEQAEAERALHDDRESASRVVAAREAVADARTRREHARTRERVLADLGPARARRTEAREASQELREGLLDLRERRLVGMAAELATALVSGESCPVCGSPEHPSPAARERHAPTRADEDAIRTRLDDAELVVAAADDRVHGLERRLAAARAVAGDHPVAELDEALTARQADLEAAETAAAALPAHEQRLAEVRERRARLDARIRSDEGTRAATVAEVAGLERRIAELTDELAAVLAGAPDLTTRIGTLEDATDLLDRAREALLERDRCRERSAAATDKAGGEATARGFADLDAARAALLDDTAAEALAESQRARQRDHDEVERVLADPQVRAAVAAAAPDLPALARAHAEADDALTVAGGTLSASAGRVERLRGRGAELRQCLADWAPVREEHARVSALAELAEGRGAENTRQMRLSAYVLSARLGQVVDAANERLVRMTDGRYLLEHTDRRGAGERRGGLGLRVLDQWTDERRDPATLSGGETFVVSLALALGLADVVTAESGGMRIDTLFVDEGFGSLDAETLELVMDALDELREGGRVVAVVSHVAEMRERVPTRLEVQKRRDGSRLRIVGA